MSIAIQKKKLNKQVSVEYSSKLSQFSNVNPHHEKYFRILNEFTTNFKKTTSTATLKSTKILLEQFYNTLKSDEFFLTDLAKHGDSASINAENILLVHEAAVIVTMLSDDIVNRKTIQPRKRSFDFDFLDKMSTETRDITALSVKILKLFVIINPRFASILSNKPQFSIKMFDLLLQDKKVYFKLVLSILEAMIAANSSIVNSLLYPHMHEALVSMPKKYFARFSRIIALIVLENAEKMDFKELSSSYTENKMIKIHSFLLSIPNIIEIYCLILEYLKEIAERMMMTTPNTARKSIRFLKETNLIKESGLNLSFLKPLFDQAPISETIAKEIFTPKFIIKFIAKKSNLTEILFIISNLLSGKRKIEVQDRLSELNFINRIVHPMFDLLFHPDLDVEKTDETDNFNSNNSLATARIQLLRTIINFCDRDSPNTDNKLHLLSAEEQNILYSKLIQKALNAHSSDEVKVPLGQSSALSKLISQMNSEPHTVTPFFDEFTLKENAFDNVEKKGLLNRIITLLNRFHPNSNYRFWLASCVESFLRGFHEAHQIFVAHTGLLYNLLNQILNKQVSKANNVQISYDLVGEMIKFNKYNMIFLAKLCETFAWTTMLSEKAFVNVVDSNVFLRALLLSNERFEYQYKKEGNAGVSSGGLVRLNKLFVENNMEWFHQIIESIDSNLVNQDNICCINTLLIVAVFADQKGKLEGYIEGLVTKRGRTGKKAKEMLQNLSNVLEVWDRYYMSKTKDSFSLEFTSSLSFYCFHQIKRKLQQILEEKCKEF